jgi:hypothetical protein
MGSLSNAWGDPVAMPAALLQAHQQVDRTVDRCDRPEPFPSDRHRVEYLLAVYELLIDPLVVAAKPPPAKEGCYCRRHKSVLKFRECAGQAGGFPA